jgi:hypothetical protein
LTKSERASRENLLFIFMQRCNVSSKLEESAPKDLSNPASMMNGE